MKLKRLPQNKMRKLMADGLRLTAFSPRKGVMRNHNGLVKSSQSYFLEGGEMRRRIADCRERLRRNRASRRITERALPNTDDFEAETCEHASATAEACEEKT
jgi:hypothetical protein